MTVEVFARSTAFLFVLLNPFLMSIYLLHAIQKMDLERFSQRLIEANIISFFAFTIFALVGDRIFTDVLQARFASFLIFGGLIFLFIGLQFVFDGSGAIASLRGESEQTAASIAMPYTIGPGTVSASILAGSRLGPWLACVAIAVALTGTVASMILLKWLHDFVRQRNERMVERYIEVVGRLMALVIGTFAIEMILDGIDIWLGRPG